MLLRWEWSSSAGASIPIAGQLDLYPAFQGIVVVSRAPAARPCSGCGHTAKKMKAQLVTHSQETFKVEGQ